MTCPSCGAEDQTGNFCAQCGAALDATCAACGAEVPAGASYCTTCGAPVAGTGAPAADRTQWILGAVAVVVVAALALVYLPGQTRTSPSSGADVPFMPPGTGSPAADPGMGLSSDMRTNADRLFNRIMMAAEQGDEAEVARFMPMAVQAYGMVDDLDDDGVFHLGLLHLTAGSYAEALATAERILDGNPDHLLGLAVAAQATEAAGDTAAATRYWERFVAAYETEAGKPLPEYVDHRQILPEYRELARQATR